MMVFSFGDRLGRPYNTNLVIDHIDMDHHNNNADNLEQITQLRNLWRASYLTKSKACRDRFQAEYEKVNQSDPFAITEFTYEMKCDIEKYNKEEPK